MEFGARILNRPLHVDCRMGTIPENPLSIRHDCPDIFGPAGVHDAYRKTVHGQCGSVSRT
jgi:hypothetical protein